MEISGAWESDDLVPVIALPLTDLEWVFLSPSRRNNAAWWLKTVILGVRLPALNASSISSSGGGDLGQVMSIVFVSVSQL